MKDEGWDCGQDDEELFELAMHQRQYRDYKSGVAKERFNKEFETLRLRVENKLVTPTQWSIEQIDNEICAAIALALEDCSNSTLHDIESYKITIKRKL